MYYYYNYWNTVHGLENFERLILAVNTETLMPC